MIVGERKPLGEIIRSLEGFRNILVIGCGGCVSVCLSGGEREARMLAEELSNPVHYTMMPPEIIVKSVERQCEPDFLENYLDLSEETDAILSLACGAGVQTMAMIFGKIPVLPALNTTFLGSNREPGIWEEMCRGCGDCVLAFTGGICPIARCAKSLLNGPCGGSQGGSCEINPEVPCAWGMIYRKLKALGKTHLLDTVRPARDWRPAGGAGPRLLQH